MENVAFAMLLNAKWWIYFIQMLILHPASVKYLVAVNYLLYVLTIASGAMSSLTIWLTKELLAPFSSRRRTR